MSRPSVDEYYLNIATTVASRSTCLKKHYGAVIVKDGEVIATGFNGTPRNEPHCYTCTKKSGNKDMDEYCSCPAVHAEQNAIISAARKDMLGATLYLVGCEASSGTVIKDTYPCEICLRLIKNSGINRVITPEGIILYRNDRGILEALK